jgi:hypothetical protein
MARRKAPENEEDDRQGIPRDASGDPVLLVLPPPVQASYDRRMRKCELGWQKTGDPAFLIEARVWVRNYRQLPPRWLDDAIDKLITDRPKRHRTRAHNAVVKWMRFAAVRAAHKSGLSWPKAYERAADDLANTMAKGAPGTMKDDYCTVKADFDEGRSRRYLQPLIPRKKDR